MTTPVIVTAKDHPRFNGEAPPEEPARKKIDTSAAKERITASRTAQQASDKPPSRPRKTAQSTPRVELPYTNGMYAKPVAMVYAQVGGVVQYVAYPVGEAIVAQSSSCGEAWDKVAKQNPTVRRWLANMTKTGAWGELFAAHLPIFMTALLTFGPDSFRERMGVVVADSMTATSGGVTDVTSNQDPN